MKTYAGFLIDLDGTIYRGNQKIDSAVRFVNRLAKFGKPYGFVTNNSSKTPRQVAERLRKFGVEAREEQIITSSIAAANYIYEEKKDASIYMIGEKGLEEALTDKGFCIRDDNPDVVVMGIDRKITYEKLAKACLFVGRGAAFIATNEDKALPTERGFLPGNGSLTAVVSSTTGIEPVFVGKPRPMMIEQALNVLGVSKEQALMIGDNYKTDILSGVHAGMDTMLVLTGVTKKAMIASAAIQPTYIVESLDEWPIE